MKKLLLILTGVLLLTACSKEELKTEEIQFGMPPPDGVFDPTHGKESWFAIGAISGVEGAPANGVAQSHFFENGHYLHTLQLNVDIAPEGHFYEGWLIRGSEVLSSGHLTNRWGDSRHLLRFESNENLRDHLKVVITLEPDDGNPAPATHVAEGIMRVTER